MRAGRGYIPANNKGVFKMITKADRIKEYNRANAGYRITNIIKMDRESIEARRKYGARSLKDLHKRPSDAKQSIYNRILAQYAPRDIVALAGSCHTFSMLLQAANGDYLHITPKNTYLVVIES